MGHMMSPDLNVPSEDRVESAITELVSATLGKSRRQLGLEDTVFSIRDHFDSYALLELVLRLEEAFGIRIGDDELDPDHFESVKTMSAFINFKLNQEQ